MRIVIVEDDEDQVRRLKDFIRRFEGESGEKCFVETFGNGMDFISDYSASIKPLFSLRTAIARLTPCASSRRKRYRLFGYKPHFRVGAGSPGADRYRFARFGECGFYLKNTMHLLRIL